MDKAELILQTIYERAYCWRRRIASIALCLIAAWVAYHAIFGENGIFVYQHKRAEYKTLNRQIYELQQDNQRLSQNVKALQSDPKTIEKEAREQLRYVRPGEVIYTLPQDRR